MPPPIPCLAVLAPVDTGNFGLAATEAAGLAGSDGLVSEVVVRSTISLAQRRRGQPRVSRLEFSNVAVGSGVSRMNECRFRIECRIWI